MTPYASRPGLIERAHRDQLIWQAVIVEGRTVKDVAEEYGLSRKQVHAITIKVASRMSGYEYKNLREIRGGE